ncbi:MAG TPA: BON domain-containing protein [Burkholderiales bacterium]|nr:BON domain-containing protein [Burkholderiales bacterium]
MPRDEPMLLTRLILRSGGEFPAPAASGTVGAEIDATVIAIKVKSALLADSDIKRLDLKVEIRNSAVQLGGFVDSQAQIDRALAIARKVDGVTSVTDKMSIKK